MELELWQLQNIIEAAAKKAVAEMMARMNPSEDEINERQAYREFGRGWVMNQLALGLVKPVRRGTAKNSPKIYSRSCLMKLKNGADPLVSAVFK